MRTQDLEDLAERVKKQARIENNLAMRLGDGVEKFHIVRIIETLLSNVATAARLEETESQERARQGLMPLTLEVTPPATKTYKLTLNEKQAQALCLLWGTLRSQGNKKEDGGVYSTLLAIKDVIVQQDPTLDDKQYELYQQLGCPAWQFYEGHRDESRPTP